MDNLMKALELASGLELFYLAMYVFGLTGLLLCNVMLLYHWINDDPLKRRVK